MEVGSLREKIIIALFIYKFGIENVNTKIPITKSEVDLIVHNEPISIKTLTGKNLNGLKLIWTVDKTKSIEFKKNYYPTCDIIFVHINWNHKGGFYFVPLEAQTETIKQIGIENYLKLPKEGTNPRGIEIRKEALKILLNNSSTYLIPILWNKPNFVFNPYNRWVELWEED